MNKKIRAITILLVIFFVSNVKAYDWDKCRKSLAKLGKDSGMYGGIATTTVFPSQFSSSWGACSALGKPEEDKKAFFNDNFDMLRINFSENNGEYLKAFISFYKCSSYGEEIFTKLVRNNYGIIFGKSQSLKIQETIHPENRDRGEIPVSPEHSFNKLQDLLEKEDVVMRECKNIKG